MDGSLPEAGALSYMGYIGMCVPKGYGFSGVSVINKLSILADFGHVLLINRVWFLYSSLDMGMLLSRETTFSSSSKRTKINKSPSQVIFSVI